MAADDVDAVMLLLLLCDMMDDSASSRPDMLLDAIVASDDGCTGLRKAGLGGTVGAAPEVVLLVD